MIGYIDLIDTIKKKSILKVDTLIIPSDILFAINSFTITDSDRLELVYNELKKRDIKKIRVVGYTDNSGTESGNRLLSLKRAQTVAYYFKNKKEISLPIVEVEGGGVSIRYAEKQLNRRVLIYVYFYNEGK